MKSFDSIPCQYGAETDHLSHQDDAQANSISCQIDTEIDSVPYPGDAEKDSIPCQYDAEDRSPFSSG